MTPLLLLLPAEGARNQSVDGDDDDDDLKRNYVPKDYPENFANKF